MKRLLPTLAGLVAFATLSAAAPAYAGWTYHEEKNDGHILAYVDDGKVVFELACGRGFALLAKHPAETKTDGKAAISIASKANKMTLTGEYVPALEGRVTNFWQSYLGYGKNDSRVYGERWRELESRLLDILGSGEPMTISAGKASYQLPSVDIDKWRRPFELCGWGFWVSPSEFPKETR